MKDFIQNHSDIIPFGVDVPVMYGLSDLSD
jgi:hypothetical protein